MRMDNYGRNLIKWHPAHEGAFSLYLEKTPVTGQVPTLLADVNDLVQSNTRHE